MFTSCGSFEAPDRALLLSDGFSKDNNKNDERKAEIEVGAFPEKRIFG